MPTLIPDWPNDADGGVFRRLAEHGFNFQEPHCVDYNVDFDRWPPPQAAIDLLESLYGSTTVHAPDKHGDGYIQFQIHALVTYEAVTAVQRTVSAAMETYGGVCESWGIMQDVR